MKHRYAHILEPVQVGNLVLKNRLIGAKCIPEGWQAQDPVPYLTEQTISFAGNIARNGASVVTCTAGMFREFQGRTFFTSPYDMDDRNVSSSFRRLIDRIHAYGAAANVSTMCNVPNDVCISSMPNRAIVPTEYTPGPENPFLRDGSLPPEITKEEIKVFIKQFTDCTVRLKAMGFDMINVYATYNASLLAKSLSPIFNQRTDEYGGSLENRARLLKELLTSVKEACGWDFPIELQISGKESVPGGYTMEDFVEYCKIFSDAGLVDIIQVRAWTGDYTHASSYNCQKENPTNLVFAEALKKANIKALVAPVGGFQDLDLIEKFIAEGRTDMVAMARAFICDPEYGRKLYEGRGEDVISCLRCDKCHSGVCAINPAIGQAPNNGELPYDPSPRAEKIAVVGGGPAGLKAASTAAKRGHSVTLFEKENYLGGQLIHADYMPNKWSMNDYRKALIRECEQSGVTVKLGTEATPEMLQEYDGIIAATGSEPKTGMVPGSDGEKVWKPFDVFGRESELGHNVVVIGGAMIGVDTALYLTQTGHHVTLITRNREPAHDYNSHSNFQFRESLWENPNLDIICNATTEEITDNSVRITVTTGGDLGIMLAPGLEPPPDFKPEPLKITKQEIPCDNVVFSAGRKPRLKEAMEFAGVTPKFAIVGDANLTSGDGKAGPGVQVIKADVNTTPHGIRHSIQTASMAGNMI